MTKQTGRLDWVDAARGVGIVLVVFGHVWRGLWEADIFQNAPLFRAVDNGIYLFHMPLFFLLSGLFFERSVLRDGIRSSIFRRVESLLYPLLIWAWFMAGVLVLAGSVTTREGLTLAEALVFPFPPKDIFWFLWALFLIQVFSMLLVRRSTTFLVTVLILSFAAAVVVPTLPGTSLLDGLVGNLAYFLTGMLLARRDLFGLKQAPLTGAIGAGVFALSVAAAITYGLQHPPLGIVLSLVATLGFCAAVYGLSPLVPARPMAAAAYLGTVSMAIYVMHIIPEAATRLALLRFGVDQVLVHLAMGTLVGIVVPVLAYEALKRLGFLRLFGLGRDRKLQAHLVSQA
jgi:fucose 4-O-acetylase-like acetyltransferase